MPESELPRLGHGIVAFIDILGFRAMVAADSGSSSLTYLPKILETLTELEAELVDDRVELVQFSDSVVLTCPFSPTGVADIVRAARRLQQFFVIRGILVRGGIAFGYHFGENQRLFSEALVKAYEIESQIARVPRIVVDVNVLDAALLHPDAGDDLCVGVRAMLRTDRDGRVFVHYLDEGLAIEHAAAIEARANQGDGDTGLLEKLHWLVDYHDYVMVGLGLESLDPARLQRFSDFDLREVRA